MDGYALGILLARMLIFIAGLYLAIHQGAAGLVIAALGFALMTPSPRRF